MKESIEKNKHLLNQKFPDDVTTTGSPDHIRDKVKPEPNTQTEDSENEQSGS